MTITDRQREVLAAIRTCLASDQTPTLDRLRNMLGLATKSGVHNRLVDLRDRGLVTWTRRHGSLRIVGDGPSFEDLARLPHSEAYRVACDAFAVVLINAGQTMSPAMQAAFAELQIAA